MSIKYGTVYLNGYKQNSYWGGSQTFIFLNNLATVLSTYGFAITGPYGGQLLLPNHNHILTIIGYAKAASGRGNKGYYLDVGDNDERLATYVSTSDGTVKDPYAVYAVSSEQIYPYARYAINDSGDWIISFSVMENYTSNRYNYPAGTAYFIGTKINNKQVIIASDANVYDDTIKNANISLYNVITRINPVYNETKQNAQIALTDFLVRDSSYDNIISVDNIKLAITHKGGFNPYLIKDDKGDEYCVIPASCPSESALVLRDTKE